MPDNTTIQNEQHRDEIRELREDEIEDVSGGFAPLAFIAGGVAGYAAYKGGSYVVKKVNEWLS